MCEGGRRRRNGSPPTAFPRANVFSQTGRLVGGYLSLCRCVVRVCVCVCVVHKGRCASRARAREQHRKKHFVSASGATLLLLANAHTCHSPRQCTYMPLSTLRTRAPLRAAPTAPPPPGGAAAVLRVTPCFFLRVKPQLLVKLTFDDLSKRAWWLAVHQKSNERWLLGERRLFGHGAPRRLERLPAHCGRGGRARRGLRRRRAQELDVLAPVGTSGVQLVREGGTRRVHLVREGGGGKP